ncbi:MAG TPA: hypothetical protein VNS61_15995 [Caldimonas sp.]|nr:hypothetical protein [Caldimonas sp.]
MSDLRYPEVAPAFEPEPAARVEREFEHPARVERELEPPVRVAREPEPRAAGVVPVAEERDYVLPVDSLQAVAESAGLRWVSSDADKVRAAQEAMAAAPPPAHVQREIRKVEPADEGPLVLVETRKDLSQVRLPFETMQPPGA